MCAEAAATLSVEVVYAAAPHRVERIRLTLPAGATAGDALLASGLADRLGAAGIAPLSLGLGGRACEPGTLLGPGDRLELLRPLQVDPKQARRLRYRRDGLKRPRKSV